MKYENLLVFCVDCLSCSWAKYYWSEISHATMGMTRSCRACTGYDIATRESCCTST